MSGSEDKTWGVGEIVPIESPPERPVPPESVLRVPLGPEPDFVELRLVMHEDRGWPGDEAPTYVQRRLRLAELRELSERLYHGTRRGRPVIQGPDGQPWEPDPTAEV